jgi:hypothetical protein
MIDWSPEVRVLRDPAGTFRVLTAAPTRGAWILVRRPLLLLLAMGLTVSLHSAGRASLRVVVDGMISFLFVPLCEIVALRIALVRRRSDVPFSRAVDAFFVSNSPWLLWLLGFWMWRFTQTPLQASAFSFRAVSALSLSWLVPLIWCGYLDTKFFRALDARHSNSVVRDLAVERAIAWLLGLGYFFGIAVWAQLVAWVR